MPWALDLMHIRTHVGGARKPAGRLSTASAPWERGRSSSPSRRPARALRALVRSPQAARSDTVCVQGCRTTPLASVRGGTGVRCRMAQGAPGWGHGRDRDTPPNVARADGGTGATRRSRGPAAIATRARHALPVRPRRTRPTPPVSRADSGQAEGEPSARPLPWPVRQRAAPPGLPPAPAAASATPTSAGTVGPTASRRSAPGVPIGSRRGTDGAGCFVRSHSALVAVAGRYPIDSGTARSALASLPPQAALATRVQVGRPPRRTAHRRSGGPTLSRASRTRLR